MSSASNARLNPWREIAILMTIVMEGSWIAPWFRSLTPETYAVEPLRVFFILGVIVLFSHILVRLMDYLKLKKSVRQVVMVIFLTIGSFAGIKTMLYAYESVSFIELLNRPLRSFGDLRYLVPVEFIIIITVLIGFWRGVTLAQEHIGPTSVMNHFWIGIVMYISFIFLITIVTGETPEEFFFIFLLSSLVGISAARMTVIGLLRGGKEVKFDRSWFVGIFLTSLLVSGLASILGGVIGNQFTDLGTLLVGLVGSFFVLVWIIINPLLTFLVSFIGKLFSGSQAVMDLGNTLQKINEMIRSLSQNLMNRLDSTGIGSFFARLAPIFKTIVFTIIIISVIAGIIYWMAIKLWKGRDRRHSDDEEKSSFLRDNLYRSLLENLLQRWNRTKDSFIQLIDFRHRQRMRAAARIRQIYAEVLELCEMLDKPRPFALTPLEFEPKIEQLFPEYQNEISTITQAYLRVRYGLLPETQSEITDVEAAWGIIYAAGRLVLQKSHKK